MTKTTPASAAQPAETTAAAAAASVAVAVVAPPLPPAVAIPPAAALTKAIQPVPRSDKFVNAEIYICAKQVVVFQNKTKT